MPLSELAISAVLQAVVLGGLPFLIYYAWHRWRHGRGFAEVARRAGLQLGEPRYILYALAAALVVAAVLLVWSPPMEPFTREGSAQRKFAGLGIGATSIAMALLYGVVQTGFTEELLFRGLIAGSLARRLSMMWANLLQALIFLLPHGLLLRVMPELWPILPVVFVGALFFGWLRMESGSILAPWLMHASANVTIALMVAAHTA